MGEDKTEPLAKTRTRRSNAGARMHEMMFAAEDDELLAQAYGLVGKMDDDSSDDEEYVPKDLDIIKPEDVVNEDNEDNDSGSEDDSSGSSDSSSSGGSSSCSDSDNDDVQDDENDEGCEDGIGYQLDGDGCDKGEDFKAIDVKVMTKKIRDKKQQSQTNHNDSGIVPNHLNIKTQLESPTKAAYDSCAKICSVCLGDQTNEDDELIECDACGVSVHESCYGVSGNNEDSSATPSSQSNLSSGTTEPWFCEPCKRSVKNPFCELCPNTGGIFKQTDTGRWIHMVCALYTRGVTFENIDNLSDVSLFELNYALFGSKACTICEDRRLARSGICIGCDAGLCKIFFHATCAQKEGLLFESHSDEVDPYFAHCKQHVDKSVAKKKKKIFTALHARLKRVQQMQNCSSNIKKSLAELSQEPNPHLTKWNPENRPPIPVKVSRMLMTSPSLIIKLTKKSELLGLDPRSSFMSVQDEIEMARQKWHIPPAFNLEFVAYCIDRTTRMANMKKQNLELVRQNQALKVKEADLREKYNTFTDIASKLRLECDSIIKQARALQKLVSANTSKQFNLPNHMEQLIARCSTKKVKSPTKSSKTTKTNTTYGCGKCGEVKDQHLLALCDTCHSHFHIYCLDPPLTRVPKKTKFGGWQCSDCSEKDEEEQEEAIEEKNLQAIQEAAEDGPRRLRERIKYPEKYCHESMLMADFWSNQKKKSRKSSSKKKTKLKRPKIES